MATDSWDNIKNTYTNSELEEEAKRREQKRKEEQEKQEKKDSYIYKQVSVQTWHYAILWSYEWRRMYKMMGWESLGLMSSGSVSNEKTGEYYLEKTSATTYDIKEKERKVSSFVSEGYKLRAPKYKITDMEGYLKLLEEAEHFVSEAQWRFGEDTVPSYYKPLLRLPIMLSKNRRALILLLITWIGTPLLLLYLILSALTYRGCKTYAKYRPLAKAYEEKMKYFKKELKKVSKF